MDGANPRILRVGRGLRAHETLFRANALQLRHPSLTTTAPDTLDTCGFISGNPDYPLTCHPGQKCAKDPVHSLVACCWTPVSGTCVVSTRCLDQSQSQLENVFDGLDMVCLDGRAPYCKTDVLSGDPELSGYSLFICDTDKVTDTILRYTTTSSIEPTPILSTTISTPNVYNTSEAENAYGVSETPASTIVGAVVGSIGALVIASAGIWALCLLKRDRRKVPAKENSLELDHRITISQRSNILPIELPCTQSNNYAKPE
ncbi:hypothetical protein PT974_06596 [Cladobotryum mycophilum]|uniref:Uncharacterized protein n=1 Tax=Cladobotryum mycophilum TaxID=491253 RepID=A0ABR0SM36_9HYPO